MLNINDVMYQVCDMHIYVTRSKLQFGAPYEEGAREEIEQHFFAE